MKRAIFMLLIVLFVSKLNAQIGYVEAQNKIYFFLERMNAKGLLENYDSFEIPKKRSEIKRQLQILKEKINLLSATDKKKLDYFCAEFSFDITRKTDKFVSLYDNSFAYLTDATRRKFLYFAADSSLGSVFVNFIGRTDYIRKNTDELNGNVFPFIFGGEIDLTFGKYFGAKLQATNGGYFGEKKLLFDEAPFKYNFKFTETSDENVGSEFFDETEGYFTAQTEYADFKIGRDRLNFGYGKIKTVFGNNSPRFDYLSANFRYKNFRISFLHGKLLGYINTLMNPNSGETIKLINDKWVAYHRFALDISKGTQIGAGETVIYYGRSLDLSYLNPFAFYKSVEHANQDRDNSMLFFDFASSDLISGAIFYFTWLIDDMDFTKLGTDWYGNNFLWNAGFSFSPGFMPSDLISAQVVSVDPYFYTHKFYDNNFTNLSFNLADNIEPNSLNAIFSYDFSFAENFDVSIKYAFENHGANEYGTRGELIKNYGGNILEGHRKEDADYVKFLSGVKEISHGIEFNARYEFITNYDLVGKIVARRKATYDYFALYLGINVVL